MSDIRELIQNKIREIDNESSFTILLSASMLPYLEEPLNRARFFDYDKKLELYFDSKDLNRFSRLKELTDIVTNRIKGNPVKGFEKYLKFFRENNLMVREKEGPTDGMAWQGFGGVHSHYSLTPLGNAHLIFQATLRCSALDFSGIHSMEYWDDVLKIQLNQIITLLVEKRLRIRDFDNHFYTKRQETSFIAQRIFEFIAGSGKRVSQQEITDFIWNRAGEIHIGEIPEALKQLLPLLQKSGDSFSLNERGEIARIGYATVIVETALSIEDTEIAHYMVSAKSLQEGVTNTIKQFSLWF
ncbi:MAG: hypothetical protein ACFFDW_07460 [Candidatus Thorarchaeota archaeon]